MKSTAFTSSWFCLSLVVNGTRGTGLVLETLNGVWNRGFLAAGRIEGAAERRIVHESTHIYIMGQV